MATAVLITDKTDKIAAKIFERENIPYEEAPSMSPQELAERLATGKYAALIVRSATKVKEKNILDKAKGLQLIVRAGSGVDSIDVQEASRKGVIVQNTPGGNANATAENAIALIFDMARKTSLVSPAMHAQKWEKGKYKGFEIANKILGIVGCGQIGSIVAEKAKALKMEVLVYDPYLKPEKAEALGVTKVEHDELLRKADIITLHTLLTPETKGMINAETIAKMKKGVCIVNCARGELIDDDALIRALDSGHVAQAAMDVHNKEPTKDDLEGWKTTNPYIGRENVVLTPHHSASTVEAQINVAEKAAEQIVAFLKKGVITNAVNMPFVAPEAKPFMPLAKNLGLFVGQMVDGNIERVTIEYSGEASQIANTDPIRNAALEGILSPFVGDVNIVSAPYVAKERGIPVSETKHDNGSNYKRLLRVNVQTKDSEIRLAGSLFSGQPWLVEVNGVQLKTPLTDNMLYVCHDNKPGMFAAITKTFGDAGVNICSIKGESSLDKKSNMVLLTPDETEPKPLDELVRKIEAMPEVSCARLISLNGLVNGKKGVKNLHL